MPKKKLLKRVEDFFADFDNIAESSVDLDSLTLADAQPQTTIATTPVVMGVAIDGNEIHPAGETPWSSEAQASRLNNKKFIQPASDGKNAIISIPFNFGAQGTGILEIIDDSEDREWGEDEPVLAEEIARHLSLSIENSLLRAGDQQRISENMLIQEQISRHKEISEALNVIQHSEHYQAAVAAAVAHLNDQGSKALAHVIQMLGEVTLVQRAYYAEVCENNDGLFWVPIAQWSDPAIEEQIIDMPLEPVPLAEFGDWEEAIREQGWVSATLRLGESMYCKSSRPGETVSLLLLGVQARSLIPCIMVFEQIGEERIWNDDEINILRLAANALSNAYIRESLLELLQDSLDEMGVLYKTAHALALAGDMQEMVDAISSGVNSEAINQNIVIMFDYNAAGKIEHMNVTATWQSGKASLPPETGSEYPVDLYTPFFCLPAAVYYDDIRDSRISTELQLDLAQRGVASLAVLPLWANKHQAGVLLLVAHEKHTFTGSEIRTYSPLVDQMATAIENQRLLEATRAAYEISKKAYEQMKEVDRLKSKFLANMSHELRTPLNAIIGFSKVILRGMDGPITERQEEDLTAINNSGQILLSLINDILDLSKIDAGKMDLSLVEVNIGELVTNVIPIVHGLIKDKLVTLTPIIKPTLPLVQADPVRLRQVLLNLLSNAAKFTNSGAISLEVTEAPDPNGKNEIMVVVMDTGVGISEKDQEKIFEPFSQADNATVLRTGGTGLGLSISRSLIEMHGGRLGILWSEPERGSAFYFTLPIPTPPAE